MTFKPNQLCRDLGQDPMNLDYNKNKGSHGEACGLLGGGAGIACAKA